MAALAACKRMPSRDSPSDATNPYPKPDPTTAIPRRPLGKTGEMVSIVGIGGYHIGIPKEDAAGIRIVRTALDRGINFLDNCWDYHAGRSEELMGKALAGGYRDKAFLMTKIDGRTKKAAAEQLDQSLTRLATPMIDLVQVHEVIRMEDPARSFAEGGCIEALVSAKKAGKIRFIGFTGHKDPNIHLEMLNVAAEHDFRFDAVQMPLNVMDAHYRSFEKLVLPVLVSKNIGVLGMKPLGAGKILRTGVVTAPECLHYAMNLPTSVVITGCDSMETLEQAIAAALAWRPMPPNEVSALLEKTRNLAKDGTYETFKTTHDHDGTIHRPEWLESATIGS